MTSRQSRVLRPQQLNDNRLAMIMDPSAILGQMSASPKMGHKQQPQQRASRNDGQTSPPRKNRRSPRLCKLGQRDRPNALEPEQRRGRSAKPRRTAIALPTRQGLLQKLSNKTARPNPRGELEKRNRIRSEQRKLQKGPNATASPTRHVQGPHPMLEGARKPKKLKRLHTGRPKRQQKPPLVPRQAGPPKPPRAAVAIKVTVAE